MKLEKIEKQELIERKKIADLMKYKDKGASIIGWVHAIRRMGRITFAEIRDGSGTVQVLILPGHGGNLDEKVKEIKPGYTVSLSGLVQDKKKSTKSSGGKIEGVEINVQSLAILSTAKELPFDVDSEVKLDTLLDFQPFTLRSQRSRAIFDVQTEIVYAFREFLRSQGFHEFEAPNLTATATEGGANVFAVEYFGRKAYLGQSPQFYKQIMVGVYEKVFTVTKAFRAEKHATSRHINEYTSLDLEMGFIKDHTTVMALQNKMLYFMAEHLRKTVAPQFTLLGATLPKVPEPTSTNLVALPSLKLREAQQIIKKEFGEDCTQEPDLEPQHEKWLCEYATKHLGSEFIYITHYPTKKRPMYTFQDPQDPEYTNGFDLLFRGLEVTTGGQRINDYDALIANIKKWNCDPEDFRFYLQAFQYGMPPEGGLAMGLERFTQQFLGLANVKEATLFPRDQVRIDVPLSSLK